MDNYLRQSAETLAMIHAIPANDFPWTYFRYARPATLKVPSWSADPSKWQEIINVLRSPQPEAPIVFMHRDYHMTNFLWHDNILSGVVDWVNACTGYAGVDIGHMRVNLASVYGIDIAEQFLQAYQTANPAFDYHPYWDIVSIGDTILYDDNPPAVYPPWVEFGVTGLSDALMLERAEAYAQHILSLFRAL